MINTELVIGGSSQLSMSLAQFFENTGVHYIKTTRKNDYNSEDIHLELSDFNNRLIIPNSVKTAYFLAGISDTQYCEMNKEYVYHVNVKKTLEVIRFLNNHSVHTVFVSSASVFDGEKQKYLGDEVKNPRNFYGFCKSEVEDVILKEKLNASILRVGKIAKVMPIIRKWEHQISLGEKPIVYSNRYISPLSADNFSQNLVTLGTAALGGVNQISACDEISYLELFNRLFPGRSSSVIAEGNSHELLVPSGQFKDFSPPPSWAAINSIV